MFNILDFMPADIVVLTLAGAIEVHSVVICLMFIDVLRSFIFSLDDFCYTLMLKFRHLPQSCELTSWLFF